MRGKENQTLFAVCCLGAAGFVSAADNWFVSPALPAIAESFHVTTATAGILLTAYMIPYGAMQPVYGYFSDRWSKIRLLRILLLGLTLGTGCGALAESLWILVCCRIITGFFAAGLIAVSLGFIGDTVERRQRQGYVGFFMGIVFAGQGVSAGLGGFLTKYLSWRGAFGFFAAAGILALFLLFCLQIPEKPQTEGRPAAPGFFPALINVLRPPGGFIFPFALAAGFLLLGIYGYLGAFLKERMGLDYLQCGLVVMCYGFACLAAGTRVGRLGARFGKRQVILAGECLGALAALLLLAGGKSGFWILPLASAVLLGTGYIFVQSTLATLALDVTPESTGLPSGVIGLGLFCGGGLGSAAGGFLLSRLGYSAVFATFGTGILILLVVTLLLKWEQER